MTLRETIALANRIGLASRFTLAFLLCTGMTACSAEKRAIGPSQPQTAPNGPSDPRIALIEANAAQLSTGGRYFAWYGCGRCHAQGAAGDLDLTHVGHRPDGGFDQVYGSIAAHAGISPSYGERMPTEQLWQITAYVRSLATLEPDRRRRQDLDQRGEPQADTWSGPVR
jgi:mono/diheme cytochrome c family protein